MAAAKKTAKKTTTRRRPAAKKVAAKSPIRVAAHTVIDTVEANVVDGFKAFRATVDAKDIQAAVEAQRKYAEAALKRTRQSAEKVGGIATTAVKDASQPLVKRVKEVRTRVETNVNEALGRAA
ncbi:phasin family protein [Pyruvatibacter sp.]|uniref:phasin family protein n=1 Tax=Pyruvatibacter sp. TaxID=1981328 RepID=UPI00296845AB|nr:phasin family protein [Alphaproteobacteria bacterium]